MTRHVVVTETSGIVRFELNRPDKLNSVDTIMVRQLLEACETVEKSATARCIIISGRGRTFCAGADLAAGKEQPIEFWVDTMTNVLQRIQAMPVAVITAVHGYALGLGGGLAMTGDFVVAEETATFGFPELHHGLVPGVIAAVLRNLVGDRALYELLFIGDRLTASEAKGYGLVTTIAAPGTLAEAAEALAKRLARSSPTALKLTKRLLQDMRSMTPAEIYRAGKAAVLVGRETEDAREGMLAFRERRQPAWNVT